MTPNEFVKKWLIDHMRPQEIVDVTPEDQLHFETILTDVVEAYWNQHPYVKDIQDGTSLIVSKDWLDQHERNIRKEVIRTSADWWDERTSLNDKQFISDYMTDMNKQFLTQESKS